FDKASLAARPEGIGLSPFQITYMVAHQPHGATREAAAPLEHPHHLIGYHILPTKSYNYVCVAIGQTSDRTPHVRYERPVPVCPFMAIVTRQAVPRRVSRPTEEPES